MLSLQREWLAQARRRHATKYRINSRQMLYRIRSNKWILGGKVSGGVPEMRVRCDGCNQIVEQDDLLEAAHPFAPNDIIHGCPICRQCEDGFTAVCDEGACEALASCGWPSEAGYRRTCYEHSHWSVGCGKGA